MSALVIRIDVLGERQISRQMMRFGERATDLLPAMEVVHEHLTEVSEEQFRTEGRQSGHPWAALKDATVERKRRSADGTTRANADKILRASDALYNSLTKPGDPNMVRVITPTLMVYGTKLKYGPIHQKPGQSQTRRRPVDLTPKQKIIMIKTLQLWIVKGIARLGSSRRFSL